MASTFEGDTRSVQLSAPAARFRCSTPSSVLSSATTGSCPSETQGFAGKVLDDWEVSGITQFQSGFPIRLNTEDDNELINSMFFLGTEAPSLGGAVPETRIPRQQRRTSGLQSRHVNPRFPGSAASASSTTAPSAPSAAARASAIGILGAQEDSVQRKQVLPVPGGDFQCLQPHEILQPGRRFFRRSDQFGKITPASDPRLLQFALKFYF